VNNLDPSDGKPFITGETEKNRKDEYIMKTAKRGEMAFGKSVVLWNGAIMPSQHWMREHLS
jgi:hypothetical protein